MLEKALWMKLAPDMVTEWRQSMEEGRDVTAYESRCRELAERAARGEDCEAEAAALYEELSLSPLRPDYHYEEPSDLEGIKRLARGSQKVDWRKTLSEAALKEKLAGAWIGRIAGCLLGKPVEGVHSPSIREVLAATGDLPMSRYIDSRKFPQDLPDRVKEISCDNTWIDRIGEAAPSDDDTNYTVLAMRLIDRYGSGFRPNDVLEAWLSWMPMFAACTAERAAYRNAAMGLYAPETALRRNPFREWIGAQIRGDFFGYLCPGDPDRAAELAWRDASISHIKNGIYGEMWIAAMIARAAVSDDLTDVIETGLRAVPPKSRLTEEVEKVLSWRRQGVPAGTVFERIHQAYDEFDGHDWCHTNSNAMIVAACLLYGEKDFGRTICMAVETGFDTDCNGATAGSVLGMMIGEKAIPAEWPEGFHRKLRTAIGGYNLVTVEELTEKTFELIEREKA